MHVKQSCCPFAESSSFANPCHVSDAHHFANTPVTYVTPIIYTQRQPRIF